MVKAVWKNKVIAETNNYEIIENNYYFPQETVNKKFIKPSETHTTCPLKGIASYYDIEIDGEINRDAAWYYPDPKPAAKKIKNYIAFWKGVVIKK